MINIKKIIGKAMKYFVAILITGFMWSWAGSMVSSKDDFTVLAGFMAYFGLFAGWVALIGSEINMAFRKPQVIDLQDINTELKK